VVRGGGPTGAAAGGGEVPCGKVMPGPGIVTVPGGANMPGWMTGPVATGIPPITGPLQAPAHGVLLGTSTSGAGHGASR